MIKFKVIKKKKEGMKLTTNGKSLHNQLFFVIQNTTSFMCWITY